MSKLIPSRQVRRGTMGINVSLFALDVRGVRRLVDLWADHVASGRYGTVETDAHPYGQVAAVTSPVSLIVPALFRNSRTDRTERTGFDTQPVALAVVENWDADAAARLEEFSSTVTSSRFPATLAVATDTDVVWRPLANLHGYTAADLTTLAATPMNAPATAVVEKLAGCHFDAGYRSVVVVCGETFAQLLWAEWGGAPHEWDLCDHDSYTWPGGSMKVFQAGRVQVIWEARSAAYAEPDKVAVMSTSGPPMQTTKHTDEVFSNLVAAPDVDPALYHRLRSEGCSIPNAIFAAAEL